jgi:two-component system, LytTR family, sensor kinase
VNLKTDLSKKNIWSYIILATVISLAIGVVFLIITFQTSDIPLSKYIWNAGYSLNIGFALFANSYLFDSIGRKYISWIHRPLKSLGIVLFLHLSYSTIAIFFVNWLWFSYFKGESWLEFLSTQWFIIAGEYVILIIITAIIYARSFFHEWRIEVTEGEKLKREAIALQYQVMQNQVNPHFLFNSLNALGSLIDIDPSKAKVFTRNLSLFYRELLYFKDKDLIPLTDEIDFVQKYVSLQKIRFGDNFKVDFSLKSSIKGDVIPMSVQMMVENAVKHNIISMDRPLTVIIGQNDEFSLFIENNLQPRDSVADSNNMGLKNLSERYKYLSNKDLEILKTDKIYRVTIPLIKCDYESTDH